MSDANHKSIGPHEDRELELMVAGLKSLSMFVEAVPPDGGPYFPEQEFDALVSEGRLIKRELIEAWRDHAKNCDLETRRVLYALPREEWRLNAMLLVQEVYRSLAPGWRPDLERIIGRLLGYDRKDVEFFISEKLS
ncbi:MAG TPA: hypothetical protein VGM57_08930 [Pseudolabrys sp.]